ncbi:hypothetical protein [Luteolibacter luteus]|uniref:DUF2339 domain-containing protein n=1 Tax=Luteolibacter luteus TaxID=2728835 RepID=A0A858RID3_9BACT|nr:hypothetical protein [Luteolibacter luteus]QJE96341.1 DUF2339 domain-containing protein [Luteolibacter luteus]
MPRSPLTWFIAFAIVLLHAVALFLQRKGDFPVMDSALSATVVPVILLGWSATRDAPPFGDRAFHRTLPPGDSVAFRGVLMVHVWVLLGISLATAIYCAYFNFGWEAVGYGLTLRTLPLGAFMMIFGVCAAIASSPGRERYLGLPLILGAPLFSIWAIPWRGLIGVEPSGRGGWFWLGGAGVLATIYYLAVWWLVSVRSRKMFAMVVATIFGLWLPWLPEIFAVSVLRIAGTPVEIVTASPMEPPVKWQRKIFPDPEGDWVPVSQVLNVTGLKKGEVARMKYLWIGGSSKRARAWHLDMRPWGAGGSLDASISKDGSILWGRQALVESLREQMPLLDEIMQLDPDHGLSDPSELMFKKPYDGPVGKGNSHLSTGYSMAEFRDEQWRAEVEVFRYDFAGVIGLPLNGSSRVPSGGRIFADILKGEDPILDSIRVRYCTTTTGSRNWIDRGQDAPPAMMILVNPNGKRAYAAELVSDQSYWGRLWLGVVHRWSFPLSGENARLIQDLQGGRAYFFLPSEITQARSESLAPPPADSPR